MSREYRLTSPKERRRGKALRIWHIFVLIVGYATIIYELARLIIYLYLQLTGATWTIV